MAAQRPWLTALVRDRVGRHRRRAGRRRDRSTCTPDLAADLPLLVLARLVELPDAPVGAVKEFARAALELFWAPLDADRQRALAAEVGRFHAVLRDVRRPPVAGWPPELRAAGHSPDVVVGALFFLLVAGQETTSQFLTLLLHRLTGEPEVRAGLRAGEVAVADVVEEGLRLEPPIVTWRRVAATDTTLGGTAGAGGQPASCCGWPAPAGTRRWWPRPAEFRPGQRGSRRHLAFGAGAHRCVGAQLARMEAAVVVAEAAPLLDGVTVVRPPWCPDNLTFRMPDAFVVRRA